MAGNSNLTVSVSADVTDLQTKLAQAQSSLTANSASLRKLANDFRKAGEDSKAGLLPAMQALAAQTASSRIEVNRLSAEFSAMIRPVNDNVEAHKKLGGVIGQNRVAFNELAHTTRAVADGMAAGINPVTLFSEEFFRVAQAITEFNTVSVSAIAGFGAIAAAAVAAAGVLYLFHQRQEEILNSRDLSAAFNAQGIAISGDTIEHYTRSLKNAGYQVSELGDLNDETMRKILTPIEELRQRSPALTEGLVRAIPDLSAMWGEKPEQAIKTVTEALGNLSTKGSELITRLNPANDAAKHFQETLADKGPAEAQRVLLDQLAASLRAYATSADAARNTLKGTTGTPLDLFSTLGRGRILDELGHGSISPLGKINVPSEDQLIGIRQQGAQLRANDTAASLSTAAAQSQDFQFAPDMSAIQDHLEQINQDVSKTSEQRLQIQIDYLAKEKATTGGSYAEREALDRLYNSKRVELVQSSSSEELEIIRTKALEAAAAAGTTRTSELATQRAVLQAGLNDEKLTADAKLELRKQLAQLELRDVRAQGAEVKKTAEEAYQEYVADINEKLDAEKGAFLQQIQTINQWVAHAAEAYGTDSKQYEAAVRRKIDVDNEWAKAVQVGLEHAAQAQKNYAEGTANLAKIGERPDVGEFKSNIGLIFNSADLQSKVAAEVAKLKAALQSDLAGISADMTIKLQAGDKVGASADYKTATQDILAYTQQVQKLNEQAAQAVQEAWQKITAPVGQAFDRILDAAMTSHGKIGLAVGKALEGIVMDYAKMAVKAGFHWVAMELAHTLATTSGVASREAAQTAANAAGLAAQHAQNALTIQSDAAVAAAGAFAATASIPIVGPALAPAAGAAAYGQVSAFQALASAEGGWDRVPFDGAPAVLHKNEMVLPASIAEGVRQMTSSGVSLPRTASLGGLRSTVNNSGDTNHAMTLNHTQVINNNGGGDDYAEQRRAMRAANAHMYGTMREWFGKGSMKLPGR